MILPVDPQIEVVVLAGNAAIPDHRFRLPAGGAARGSAADQRRYRSPTSFYTAGVKRPALPRHRGKGSRRRHILADIAHQFWAIPRQHIVVGGSPTNCGENARFTREMLEERALPIVPGVVIQDPTMQRRTMATFARVWQDDPRAPTWYSTPGARRYGNRRDGVTFGGEDTGPWPVGRYLALILGELPRLADNPQGYGPLGQGFYRPCGYSAAHCSGVADAARRPSVSGCAKRAAAGLGSHKRFSSLLVRVFLSFRRLAWSPASGNLPVCVGGIANGQIVLLNCDFCALASSAFMKYLTKQALMLSLFALWTIVFNI